MSVGLVVIVEDGQRGVKACRCRYALLLTMRKDLRRSWDTVTDMQ